MIHSTVRRIIYPSIHFCKAGKLNEQSRERVARESRIAFCHVGIFGSLMSLSVFVCQFIRRHRTPPASPLISFPLIGARELRYTTRRGVSVAICEIIAIRLMTRCVISAELKIDIDRLQKGRREGERGVKTRTRVIYRKLVGARGRAIKAKSLAAGSSSIVQRLIRVALGSLCRGSPLKPLPSLLLSFIKLKNIKNLLKIFHRFQPARKL